MSHHCSKACLCVNRDGTIVCCITGICKDQVICRNDFKPQTNTIFTKFQTKDNCINATAHSKQKTQFKLKHPILVSNLNPKAEIRLILTTMAQVLKQRNIIKDQQVAFEIYQLFVVLYKANALKGKREAVVVASLYLMKDGKKYQSLYGVMYTLMQHKYLIAVLPSIANLRFTRIPKNLIRIGSNLIQRVLRDRHITD